MKEIWDSALQLPQHEIELVEGGVRGGIIRSGSNNAETYPTPTPVVCTLQDPSAVSSG